VNLDERLRSFDGMRRALLDELETLDPAVLEAKPRAGKWSILEIVEHPVAGPLTVEQAVRMLRVHVGGHVRQIRALQRFLA
jgi:hypothetical protein